MKLGTSQLALAGAALAAVALVAAGAGYWAGQRVGGEPGQAANAAGGSPQTQRKPLYYRNPMGLADTSPVPKKDPMGMDYIAVFEDERDEAPAPVNQIRISTEKVQKLGVKTEAASLRKLDRTIRAAGRIEADERRLYAITPKFEGYVERLHVNATGQPVAKGQPLFEVYSPELVSAQREYAIAVQGLESLKSADAQARTGMRELADASLARLKNWDVSETQITALTQSGEARRTLTFHSPVNGIITEKKAQQGMRFMPGEALYQVADLSRVWVIADVFEQDIALVKTGAKARVQVTAYPGQVFEGAITYVYPTLSTETRSVAVRIELANPKALLKPGMFAQIELQVGAKAAVVTVPLSAVIDSGARQMVLVQAGEGRYEPREVKLGARSDHEVEVREGVRQGELVVVTANFLIDAESNLKAAVSGFGPAPGSAATAAPTAVGHQAEGRIEAVDAKEGTVSIAHGPIASLQWPSMTMDFTLAHATLIGALKPGDAVVFNFVERQPGEWVIVKIEGASTPANAAHKGH